MMNLRTEYDFTLVPSTARRNTVLIDPRIPRAKRGVGSLTHQSRDTYMVSRALFLLNLFVKFVNLFQTSASKLIPDWKLNHVPGQTCDSDYRLDYLHPLIRNLMNVDRCPEPDTPTVLQYWQFYHDNCPRTTNITSCPSSIYAQILLLNLRTRIRHWSILPFQHVQRPSIQSLPGDYKGTELLSPCWRINATVVFLAWTLTMYYGLQLVNLFTK